MEKSIQDFEARTKHPRDFVERFVKQGILASSIKRESPRLYEELRADAVALGLLGESISDRTRRLAGIKPEAEQTYNASEHAARLRFPEDLVKKAWETQKIQTEDGRVLSLVELRKVDPVAFHELEVAARSYGVTHRDPSPVQQRPQASEEEPRFAISDAHADAMNLPRGTMVTSSEFSRIVSDVAIARRQQAERESAQAKPDEPNLPDHAQGSE